MDCEVDQALAKIAAEREDLEKELEALSNELKGAYANAAMGGGRLSSTDAACADRSNNVHDEKRDGNGNCGVFGTRDDPP